MERATVWVAVSGMFSVSKWDTAHPIGPKPDFSGYHPNNISPPLIALAESCGE
jgi:hypothetical protein